MTCELNYCGTVDASLRFAGRSSDLLRNFLRLPIYPGATVAWLPIANEGFLFCFVFENTIQELTAAGLSGIFTRFPCL